CNPAELIQALSDAWINKKKQSLSWPKYCKGWSSRNKAATARALAMAMAVPSKPAPVPPNPAAPAAPARALSASPLPATITVPMTIIDRFVDLAGFKTHVDGLRFPGWRPAFIVVHNTSAPDLALYNQWRARGPARWTPEQWGRNLASYYAGLG